MKKYFLPVLFLLIILLGGVLRFYKLGKVPSSLSWDEAAVGYNAWTILKTGKDEWGRNMPLVFKSFEDYKHPVHVYLTVPSIAIFGLNEYGVRASSAFFGVLNVIIIFFLAKRLLKSDIAGLLTSLFLAISPYNIHFSRYNHELNFVLFFFMLGLYLILLGIEKKNYLITVGLFVLGLDLLTYHSAKIVVPLILILVIILFAKDLWRVKKFFFAGIIAFSFFIGLLVVEPQLLGGARFAQTSSSKDRTFSAIASKYLSHLSPDYLFLKGDPNPRLSSQTGTFYIVDSLFLVFGLICLVYGIVKKKSKEYFILLAWMVLAPLPATLSSEAPHASRAMFMTGSWHIVAALGVVFLISRIKFRPLKFFVTSFILFVVGMSLFKYLENYYQVYSERYAIEWQYGMKDVVSFVNENPRYHGVYVTSIRQQPYIFFLFYLQTPLYEFLSKVEYDSSQQKSYNTVAKLGNIQFGGWDVVESFPYSEILYVIQPADYTGLRYKDTFEVVKLIKYPNGADAFYLVAMKKE